MAAHRSKPRSWEDISAETIRSVVPPSPTRVEETEDKESSAFQISLQSVDGVYRPDVGESSAQLQYQLRVSLYDIMYHTFFGRTWVGPARAAKVDKAKQKYKLQYQQPIYFHTSLKDPNIVAVIEVVGTLDPSPGSTQPRRQMSCGWSLLRLFQKSQKLKDTSEGTADVRKLDVYHGSPRALMLMDDAIETNENIQLVKGCQIAFSLSTHQALEKILHLVPENVLVGGNDAIPGIQEQRSKGKENVDNLLKPKLLKTLQSHLDNISITPEPSLVKFEEDLCKKANDDRLERDNIGPSDGSTVNVVERRLQIGLHNGWGYVQKPQVVILAPEVETQGRARSGSFGKGHRRTPSFGSKSSLGNSSCLVARSQVQLSDLAQDASFAIVFQVEYTLSVPFALSGAKLSGSMSRAQTITVPVLWVSWCPFTASGRPDVTVTMRCGSAPNPDNVMMFCQKSGAEQQNAGSLKFTFRRDDEPPRTLDAQDQLPNQMLQIPGQQYAPSVHSETSDGSFMQERPTTVSSRPPLPSSAKGSPRTEHRLPAYSTPLPGSLPPPLSYPTISLPYPLQSHTTPPHMLGDTTMDTSDVQPDSARTEEMTELTELPYTPVHAPILLSARGTQSGQGLSRAAYARLYTAGFPPIVDRHGQSPEVIDPGDHVTVNLKQEEADPLQSNEIIFQFLAFSKMLSAQPSGSATSQPSTVFFTLQFYRFPPLITERLLLGTADKQLTSDPGSMPCILYRINKDGTVVQTPPGCQTKYHMDPSFLKPGEARLFVRYLSVQTLHIDVWDGDSLLLIGSCAMDLKHLCRQGREAVQVTHELDVITTEYSEDTPTLTGDLTRGGSVRPVGVSTLLKGRLHLRMANVGHLQDKARGDGTVTVPKPPSRVVLSATSQMGPATNTSNGSPLMKQKTSCAKRLAETDNELALVLTARKDPNITQLASLDTGGELDSVRKRKLARMQAVRQTQGCEKDLNTVNTVLLQKEEKAQRNRDLRTVELYREQTKHDGITSMLSQVITTHYTVFPSLGTAEFFEFVLKNPYNVEHTITVDSDSLQLSIITDVREWRQFKQVHDLNTPLEESMFGTTSVSGLPAIFLRPRESVYVPFKYQSLQADHTVQPQGPSDTMTPNLTTQMTSFRPSMHHSRNIKVYFRAEDHRPVSILTVNVIPQPHVVDQTFRFYHPEQSFLKKAIRLPPYHQLQGAVVTAGGFTSVTASCSDPNVICETRKVKAGEPQDVFLKVACGPSPSVKKFFVIIYTDPHQSKPCQIWQFYLHALQRVDISCVEGQTSRFSLILRGTNASRLVRVFPSHPTEIQVSPDTPFMLAANAVHEVNVGVRPLSVGSKFLYINVVDTEYHQLIRTWLICMQTKEPVISKAFDLQLPIGGGKGCNKRIPYTNPYMHRKTFLLHTNRQDLLQFKENTFELGSGDVYTIGMRFAPSQQPGTTNILIFINDEDDKNEETFCIKANYS